MRYFTGLAGVFLGTGLCATGATVVVGCGEDFNGCEAARTCGSAAGKGGMGATAGKSGAAGASSGKGGGGGVSGTSSGATGGKGGKGGASGASGEGGVSASAGGGGVDDSSGGDAGGGAIAATTSSGDGGASGEAGTDSGPPAEEPPHIVATSPQNGETGVLDDTDIIVTFSEPMDNAATEAAYSSQDLPPDQVTLSWKENSTKLLIHPTEPLVYADVDGLDGDAKHYAFTIGGTATDVAGNPLGDDRNYVFTTMRHITATLEISSKQYGIDLYHPTDGSADTNDNPCVSGGASLHAGDTAENAAVAFVAAFDLRLIPGAIEWASARLRGTFTPTERDPFARLGDLFAYNIVGELSSFDWDTPLVEDLGAAATYSSIGKFNVNVLGALKREYEYRDERRFAVQFRFEDPTDDDDDASFIRLRCDSLLLDLSVTAP
jgi:hypothetical protein